MSVKVEKQGWVKRTTIDEPRLSEITELYTSLGFEVRVEPVKLDELDEDYKKCYKNIIDELKNVYVRKRK